MIRRSDTTTAMIGIAAEYMFILLPLLVIVITTVTRGVQIGEVFAGPEWSVTSAILGGLAVVRLVSGMAHVRRASTERVALAIAFVVTLAVVPALVILGIVAFAVHPAAWVVSAQILQFLVCSAVFFIFGTLGQIWGKLSIEEEYLDSRESQLAEHKRREVETAVIGVLEASHIKPRPRSQETPDD